jgi:uncharacterized protein (DUF58 family)
MRDASPLSPELFQQIRAIQIRTQRLVTDAWAGEYESAFRGQGMEFEDVREYVPGDDIRRIDWNVTARAGVPYVKQHREERELTVVLVVDVSSSGAFGSVRKTKNEVAAEVAAVLAYAAIKSHDKVGLLAFTDHVEHFVPAKKGRAHLWRVIRDILTFEPRGSGTSIAGALDFLGRVQRRRAVVFLVSDFLDQGYEQPLRLAARRHDVTAVRITDPRELALPAVGLLELEDLETGQRTLLDTADAGAMTALAAATRRDRASTSERLRAAGVGEIAISTDQPFVEPIIRYFRSREHRHAARRR